MMVEAHSNLGFDISCNGILIICPGEGLWDLG